jgi:hypothetical protein
VRGGEDAGLFAGSEARPPVADRQGNTQSAIVAMILGDMGGLVLGGILGGEFWSLRQRACHTGGSGGEYGEYGSFVGMAAISALFNYLINPEESGWFRCSVAALLVGANECFRP